MKYHPALVAAIKKSILGVVNITNIPSRFLFKLRGGKLGINCRISGVKFPLDCSGITIGNNVYIRSGSVLTIPLNAGGKIIIGDNTAMGYVTIFAQQYITIGSGCLFSDNIHISDSEHIVDGKTSPVITGLRYKAKIIIGDNCYIGKNVVLLPGTWLMDNIVVGANAVVNTGFVHSSIIGGIPAKFIKNNLC